MRPDGIYLDATAGLGGHSGAIAERLTTGYVIANDRDAESLELAKLNTSQWADRIRFHHGPFSELRSALAGQGIERVDGLLADLGVSRYQLTEPERGFSLMADGPLDMRQDRSQELTAGRDCEFYCRKGTGRLDLSIRRGKEVAENQQSNRSGAAHPFDTAIVAGDRGGCAPYEQNTSGHANVPGVAYGGERRARGIGSTAGRRAGVGARRRTHGGRFHSCRSKIEK